MKVYIKDMQLPIEVKSKGMEFEIRSPKGEFLGDMILSKTGLTWCKGKAQIGKHKRWEEIMKYFDEE